MKQAWGSRWQGRCQPGGPIRLRGWRPRDSNRDHSRCELHGDRSDDQFPQDGGLGFRLRRNFSALRTRWVAAQIQRTNLDTQSSFYSKMVKRFWSNPAGSFYRLTHIWKQHCPHIQTSFYTKKEEKKSAQRGNLTVFCQGSWLMAKLLKSRPNVLEEPFTDIAFQYFLPFPDWSIHELVLCLSLEIWRNFTLLGSKTLKWPFS